MRYALSALVALAAVSLSTPAQAQSGLSLRTDARLSAHIDSMPSPGKALVGSLVSTVAPLAASAGLAFGAILFGSPAAFISAAVLGGSALAIGPSIGQFYVGNTLRGVLTALARSTLISGAIFFGIAAAVSSQPEYYAGPYGGGGDGSGAAGGWLAASAGCAVVAVGLAIWDIVDAPLTAKRKRREARRGLSLAPILRADRSGARTYGLAASVRF